MVKASKRSRPESAEAEPSEVAEPENKRSRAARRPAPPEVQQDVVEIQAPGRDRREVMADVARRYGQLCAVLCQACSARACLDLHKSSSTKS